MKYIKLLYMQVVENTTAVKRNRITLVIPLGGVRWYEKIKDSGRASAMKGAGQFQMPWGGFRLPEGERQGQVVEVLGIENWHGGCRQTRAVEEGKDEGGVGMEGGRNKRAGCMGGPIRVFGDTRHMA